MNRQTGFSLIELTVVLLLMTLLTSIAVRETSELAFQTRYEQTKERLGMIRHAILGNPKLIVNGQQAVSGFVADMGRLPVNLRELVQRLGDCDNDLGDVSLAQCTALGGTWTASAWNSNSVARNDSTTGLRYGWNGPYLSISGNPADLDALTDGWGRLAQGYCSLVDHTTETDCTTAGGVWTAAENDFNFGWYFDTSTYPEGIFLLSYGKDQIRAGAAVYDQDYPTSQPAISRQDWKIDLSAGISANFVRRFGEGAYCGFLNADAGSYGTRQQCENAGGNWSGAACTAIDETSCKSVGGKWQACFFAPVACDAAGGSSSAMCYFSSKSCIAAAGGVSVAWDSINHNCAISSNQTYCINAGAAWNSTTSRCDFNLASCGLAGGAWVQDCSFDQIPCTSAGGTWNDVENPASCSFSQSTCLALNGSSNNSDCYMSHAEAVGTRYDAASCQAALGHWTGRLCMNVFYRDGAAIKVASSAPIFVGENGTNATHVFTGFKGGGATVKWLPAGKNAVGIYEFDGDCNTDNPLYPADRQAPIPVDFYAHASMPVINW